jgi:hypothetical protein
MLRLRARIMTAMPRFTPTFQHYISMRVHYLSASLFVSQSDFPLPFPPWITYRDRSIWIQTHSKSLSSLELITMVTDLSRFLAAMDLTSGTALR